jgi:hypothetical protein
MSLSQAVALFFGGVFLANFVPHFAAGVSGRRFPTPFAKPAFRGLSPPPVNVLYALLNLAVAYALIVVVARFELQRLPDALVFAAGLGLAAMGIGWRAGKLLPGA